MARIPIEPLEPRTHFATTPPVLTDYPSVEFTLTTQSVSETQVTSELVLDRIEGIVRALARFQDGSGAIIDPDAGREVQYSTPYFAYALATLLSAGRAMDLLPNARLAMQHATGDYAGGKSTIPDQHGEFYLFPLAESYRLLRPFVSSSLASTWFGRLQTPIEDVLTGHDWNWRTYAMKGAWALAGIGTISVSDARSFIESSWTGSQRDRLSNDTWNLYHDETSDPDTLPYDYASRGNLSFLITAGYNGASAAEIRDTLLRGNEAGLYMVDATGQAPAMGRSSEHVWNDVVAAVTFERSARYEAAVGDITLAGRYRRAANLSIQSIDRWRLPDGSYFVTKNRFASEARIGFADYSFVTNYNGYVMLHLSELHHERRAAITEVATPAEVGGYAIQTDDQFRAVFADAGGLQLAGSLRGDTSAAFGQKWTELGITRISRAGWDSRLGALGVTDMSNLAAVSLAPTLCENGKWKRLAEMPHRYEATFSSQVVSPVLVKVMVAYAPRSGYSGPTFNQMFSITPDSVQVDVVSSADTFGLSLPLLISDGGRMESSIGRSIATTYYRGGTDSLNYLLLAGQGISDPGTRITGATGTYAPLVARGNGQVASVMVYPATRNDPSPSKVQSSYRTRRGNYTSLLGQVTGSTYIGRFSTGGVGSSIDLNSDGVADLVFDQPLTWSATHLSGNVTAVETDTLTFLTYKGSTFSMSPFQIRYFAT